MNADGSGKSQVTKEDFRLLNQPSWSPDGRFIVAKKHFTTGRSLGTGEIWLYHVSGGGGVLLVKRASEKVQKELGEPVFSPDGKASITRATSRPGRSSNMPRIRTPTCSISSAMTSPPAKFPPRCRVPGGSVRPAPSPDGKRIAFVRREATKSKLYVKDIASGVERKLYDALDQDVQETWAVTGVYPNMDWTPDSRSIVFWAGGKIRRVDADSGAAREIPFRVNDTRGVADAPHPQIEVAPAFSTKMPRFAEVSPDGRTVVFESLGKLWLKPMAGGAPRRLTGGKSAGFELFPSWSRDGRTIVFVDWTDGGLGHLMTVGARGGVRARSQPSRAIMRARISPPMGARSRSSGRAAATSPRRPGATIPASIASRRAAACRCGSPRIWRARASAPPTTACSWSARRTASASCSAPTSTARRSGSMPAASWPMISPSRPMAGWLRSARIIKRS
jgi:Tol biopolymer transport system component